MAKRVLGIPPPLRGVSERDIGEASGVAESYQPQRDTPKSITCPRLVPVSWSETKDGELVWDADALTASLKMVAAVWKRPGSYRQFLGEHSPLFVPAPNLAARRPDLGVVLAGDVWLESGRWWLKPVCDPSDDFTRPWVSGDARAKLRLDAPAGVRLALDGAWLGLEGAELRHGQLLDAVPALGAPAAWLVQLDERPPALPALGPLVAAERCGAFTFEQRSDGLHGVLRRGTQRLGLSSLDLFRRVLLSPLSRRLRSLELHVFALDAVTELDFIAQHEALARTAPFTVTVVHEATKQTPVGRSSSLRPVAQFPADRWRCVPLSWDDGHWVLRHPGEVWRWEEVEGALFTLGLDGERAPRSTPWLSIQHAADDQWQHAVSGFRLLPQPSPFLAGARLLPDGPLRPALVAVFADQLESERDGASVLIGQAARGDVAAVKQLWSPYHRMGGASNRDVFEGEHCAGFFERLRVRMWREFHKDLPAILSHPMLQRLEQLTLVGADSHWDESAQRALLTFSEFEADESRRDEGEVVVFRRSRSASAPTRR